MKYTEYFLYNAHVLNSFGCLWIGETHQRAAETAPEWFRHSFNVNDFFFGSSAAARRLIFFCGQSCHADEEPTAGTSTSEGQAAATWTA